VAYREPGGGTLVGAGGERSKSATTLPARLSAPCRAGCARMAAIPAQKTPGRRQAGMGGNDRRAPAGDDPPPGGGQGWLNWRRRAGGVGVRGPANGDAADARRRKVAASGGVGRESSAFLYNYSGCCGFHGGGGGRDGRVYLAGLATLARLLAGRAGRARLPANASQIWAALSGRCYVFPRRRARHKLANSRWRRLRPVIECWRSISAGRLACHLPHISTSRHAAL